MTILLDEFKADLDRIRRLVDAMELFRGLSGFVIPTVTPDPIDTPPPVDTFTKYVAGLHDSATKCQADVVVLSGTAILYMAGRFENYIRTLFEELCDAVATKCSSYDSLPKAMRANLVLMTAEVMKDPRKYGHAEKGVESFIRVLASNLADRTTLESINSACLSITYENMRADTVTELFQRIGADKLWDRVGEQAAVQAHFQTGESAEAKNKCMKSLNAFMEMRNKIAHPSRDVTWPDGKKVIEHIEFLEVIATAIFHVSKVFEGYLPGRANPSSPNTSTAAPETPALNSPMQSRENLSAS